MKPMLKGAILFAVLLVGTASVQAQLPNLSDMARSVDDAAADFSERQNTFLGFKKLEMPKPLEGLLDIRFRKPQLPKFGFLEKLKNIGKPQFGSAEPATQGPIMAGLSKLFPPRQPGPSFWERMTGAPEQAFEEPTFGNPDVSELTRVTQDLKAQFGRMSREAKANAGDLLGQRQYQSGAGSPQPPLRSARQYSGQQQSRF